MSYNKKEIKVSSPARKPAKPKDVIFDPEGQKNHPWEVTKILGDTMSTDGYGYIPLYVVPDFGDPQMIYPNTGDHVFPGASSFTEYPQMDEMRYGGLKKPRKKTNNPAVGINDLMLRNPSYHTRRGMHYVPFKEEGGSMNNYYLNRYPEGGPINIPGFDPLTGIQTLGQGQIPMTDQQAGELGYAPLNSTTEQEATYPHGRYKVNPYIPPVAPIVPTIPVKKPMYPTRTDFSAGSKGPGITPFPGESPAAAAYRAQYYAPPVADPNSLAVQAMGGEFSIMQMGGTPNLETLQNQYYSDSFVDGKVDKSSDSWKAFIGAMKYQDLDPEGKIMQHYIDQGGEDYLKTHLAAIGSKPGFTSQRLKELFYPLTHPSILLDDPNSAKIRRAGSIAKTSKDYKQYGGEWAMDTIYNLAKKQFGGTDAVGSDGPAPSIDSITGEKKNFFNNYIRNNVSKAMAEELHQEIMNQHMMPDGSMMSNSDMQNQYAQYGGIRPTDIIPQNHIPQKYYSEDIVPVPDLERPLSYPQKTNASPKHNPEQDMLDLIRRYRPNYKAPISRNLDPGFDVAKSKNSMRNLDPGFSPMITDSTKANSEYNRYLNQREDGSSTMMNYAPGYAPDLYNEILRRIENNKIQQNYAYGGNYNLPKAQQGMENPFAPTPECSEIDKKTPGHTCYIPGYLGQPVVGSGITPMENSNQGYDYSTPQGSFDAQGNQTTDPYGQMPQVDPYFASQNPMQGLESVNVTPNTSTFDLNNQDAPQVDQGSQIIMDSNQMRTDAPVTKANVNPSPSEGFQFSSPSGTDVADSIIGTMNSFSKNLERKERKRQEEKNKWRFSGDNMFQPMPEQSGSRGDYDPNSGIFRANQYVPVQYPGTNYGNIGSNMYAQYGGAMDENKNLEYIDPYGLQESVDTTNLYKNPYFPEYSEGPTPKSYEDASKLAQQIKYQQYLEYINKTKNEFNFDKRKGKLIDEMFTYQEGGNINYNEGDEVYMTDEELQNYLKAGGQVQFLD